MSGYEGLIMAASSAMSAANSGDKSSRQFNQLFQGPLSPNPRAGGAGGGAAQGNAAAPLFAQGANVLKQYNKLAGSPGTMSPSLSGFEHGAMEQNNTSRLIQALLRAYGGGGF